MNRFGFLFAFGIACGAGVFADTVDPSHETTWLRTVTEGYYNDPANWPNGNVPADGVNGLYGIINFAGRNVTIKAPAAGLVENSGTIFLGCGNAGTLTIDTRGTYWTKRILAMQNDWWGSPFAASLSGQHVMNFESLRETGSTVWTFTNALLTWNSTWSTSQKFDFREGTFFFGRPLYLGSVGGNIEVNVHPDATISAAKGWYQRGNSTTHTRILGGSHTFTELILKDQNSGNTTETWFHMTNDAVIVASGNLYVANRYATNGGSTPGKSIAYFDMSSTSRMTCNDACVGAGDVTTYNLGNEGHFKLWDSATFTANGRVKIGASQASSGEVILSDDSVLNALTGLYLGTYSNAVGRLVATGNSVVNMGANASVTMAFGSETATAVISLADNAKLIGGVNTVITNKSKVVGNASITLSGNAEMQVAGIFGAKPSEGTDAMSFVSDGGKLTVAGNVDTQKPYFGGCVGVLGAGGLTIDTHSINISIDQDFVVDDEASNAAFVKTGAGIMTVLRESSHPRTVVSQGVLKFAPGVSKFGRKLEFANGTSLTITDTAVSADEIVFDGVVMINIPSDCEQNRAYPLFETVKPFTAAQLAQVHVANPVSGKDYDFTLGADGKTMNVVVTDAVPKSYTWIGGVSGSWNVDSNWSPAGKPKHNDTVTVSGAATISVDETAAVSKVVITTTEPVSITGEAAMLISEGVEVAVGGALTISAPVNVPDGTVMTKDGSGKLVISGDNRDALYGKISLQHGVTEFTSAASLGADYEVDGALAISNCTFRYTGEAVTVKRPWQLDGNLPAIFDIATSLTFDNFRISLMQGDNGIVKTGAGELALVVPKGTTVLSSWEAADRKGNVDPTGSFVPSNGETVNWNGLGQLSVLEGKLTIRGQGKTVSTVRQEHHAALGGGNWNASAPAKLYLKDINMIQGSGNGFHMRVDQSVRSGMTGSAFFLDNANFTCNGLDFGFSRFSGNTDTVSPYLSITNGTLDVSWNMQIPADTAGFAPIVRVGQGGLIRRKSATVAGGITFARTVNARFEDGGTIEVSSPQNLWFSSTATGEIAFTRGGKMKVQRVLCGTSHKLDIAFDGGIAEFTLNGGISSANTPGKVKFRADAGGGELNVSNAKTHYLAIPLSGSGTFTKTGNGTLVITNDLTYTVSNNNPVYTKKTTDTVKVANAGGVRISEGKVVCAAGTTDAASHFSGTGTLSGSFGDSFFIDVAKNATSCLTLDDVTVGTIYVNFGYTDTDPAVSGSVVKVAKLSGIDAYKALKLRARHLGLGKTADFTFNETTGEIEATIRNAGFIISIR